MHSINQLVNNGLSQSDQLTNSKMVNYFESVRQSASQLVCQLIVHSVNWSVSQLVDMNVVPRSTMNIAL